MFDKTMSCQVIQTGGNVADKVPPNVFDWIPRDDIVATAGEHVRPGLADETGTDDGYARHIVFPSFEV
jgi:hypothetical protein